MLKLPADVKIYLAVEPCDMRRQLDGLAALVRSGMEKSAESGDLYIFRNRRGDMIKALFHDRHGFCMLVKRLKKGSFRIDVGPSFDPRGVEVTADELGTLLSELKLMRTPPQPS